MFDVMNQEDQRNYTGDMIEELSDTVQQLEREIRNANVREKRAKQRVKIILDQLKENRLITDEIKNKLDLYAGIKNKRMIY